MIHESFKTDGFELIGGRDEFQSFIFGDVLLRG